MTSSFYGLSFFVSLSFYRFFTHKPSFTTKLTFLTFLKFPLKMPPKHIRFTSSSSEEDENFGDDDAGGPHGTPSSSLHADAGRRSSVERKPRGELQGGASSSNKKRRLSLPSSLPSLISEAVKSHEALPAKS